MVTTRNNSARASSPTPSDSSDVYWDVANDRITPSPAPSETADVFGWPSDAESIQGPMETHLRSHDSTPTPQTARPSSPASVVEVSGEDFPSLVATTPTTVTKPRAKAAKAKGKGKAKAAAVATTATEDDDPFLAADTAVAIAASLGLTTSQDHATEGASSSRRPAAAPGSPSKRLRSNTAGEAVPSPFSVQVVATPDAAQDIASPAAAPSFAAAVAAPVAAPIVASAAAPIVAPAAEPVVAPAAALPAVAAPGAAPAALAAADDRVPAAAAPHDAPAPAAVADPAAPAALPPLWLTADGLPPRGLYTPVPPGTDLFPMYDDVGGPKFFISVSGGNGVPLKTHGLIRESLGNFANIGPTDFSLGTPPVAANGTSLALWLVADIPAERVAQEKRMESRFDGLDMNEDKDTTKLNL
ncbi:hypothetical protein DFH06DRAFT_1315757 [Mycena polygramma]|nr:hypothetical protein DFH06DRAFT_1315757 [Mycena polygramma]